LLLLLLLLLLVVLACCAFAGVVLEKFFSSAMIIGQFLLFCFFVLDFNRAVSHKIGNCPILSVKVNEDAQDACHQDEDCEGRRICCRTIVGRVCMNPEERIAVEREGRCPMFTGKVKLDARDQCVRHDECDEDRHCCQTVSGKVCLKPVHQPAREFERTDRECPKFSGRKLRDRIDRCDIDEDCEREWMCCDTAAGRRCLLPD
ncbi:Antileukoproteinase, partial [Trichinella pseudospiralis]